MKKIIIDDAILKSLLTLASVIEARDPYTGGHTWRVSRYAVLLGKRYGLTTNHLFILELGALVHDLGKIGVSDAVLNKAGPLEEQEFAVIKQHPVVGAEISRTHPLYDIIRHAVTEHHERIDGTGYPGRIDGDGITLWGKIISLADTFDAMTSTRSYRPAMAPEKALSLIEEGKGTRFDPLLTELFLELCREGAFRHVLHHAGENRLLLTCPKCGPVIPPRPDTRDGETLQCPVCTGRFVAHKKDDSFEIEFTGKMSGIYVPRADEETIRTVLKKKRKTLKL